MKTPNYKIFTYQEALDQLTFDDGSPFGKLKS